MRGNGKLDALTSIVAIDVRGAIGCDNSLPWRLRTDMAFFKDQTTTNTVIMGRKTFESLGSKPLSKRNNIVLSHNGVLFPSIPNCQLANSVDEALVWASEVGDDQAFVIGGAQTYSEFDGLVDRYLVTIVDHKVPNADAFLANEVLRSMRCWDRREIMSVQASHDQDEFAFSVFEVSAPNLVERRLLREARIAEFLAKAHRHKVPSRVRTSYSVRPQDAFAF